jgi:hypothetical protein
MSPNLGACNHEIWKAYSCQSRGCDPATFKYVLYLPPSLNLKEGVVLNPFLTCELEIGKKCLF